MTPIERYPPGALGRAPFAAGGPTRPRVDRDPELGAPPASVELLGLPIASDHENGRNRPGCPDAIASGSPQAATDELARAGVTPSLRFPWSTRFELTSEGERARLEEIVATPLSEELELERERERRLEDEARRRGGDRRGIFSRHARAVAAELDGKEQVRRRELEERRSLLTEADRVELRALAGHLERGRYQSLADRSLEDNERDLDRRAIAGTLATQHPDVDELEQVDDEPPPDYGPPGSGAVIVELEGGEELEP